MHHRLRRELDPEVHIDVPAVVGQFLTDLTLFDLVIELIQNELDAGSPNTTISFRDNALICEGGGKPIDRSGWNRLRHVLGAGGDVEAKVDGIGSKNHGLRSAFLLGDTIVVQSAAKRIDLTVRGDLSDSSRFFPAVWPQMPDPTAPKRGTRITVPYRTSPITVPNGDKTTFDVETPEKIAALLAEAVAQSPTRFIAASAPGRKWYYELTLASAATSSVFIFECEPLRGRYGDLFRRTCRIKAPGQPARVVLRQLGSGFDLRLAIDDHGKVPRMFRRGDHVRGEISWCVDRSDLPLPGCGALRYPIGYPTQHVRSGYGFDISDPFISARARHSLSDDARNGIIRDAGRLAFACLMRHKLIPLFGANPMALISSLRFPDPEAESQLLADLLDRRALPIAKAPSKGNEFTATTIADLDSDPVITIASPSYDRSHVAANLKLFSGSVTNVLHPSVPERVVEALFRMKEGGDGRVVWFNERDAARAVLIVTAPNAGEKATTDWIERGSISLAALDVARHRAPLPSDLVKQLKTQGVLPTQSGKAARWADVRRSAKPVPDIPGIVAPDILHSRLSKFTVFKDGALKIPLFDINEFVSNKNFNNVIAAGRQRFFNWLRKAHTDLSAQALKKIGCYPIWPGADGVYRPLGDYCWPSSPHLRSLVHAVKPIPAADVVSFRGLRRGANGALRLRTRAEDAELREWYLSRCNGVAALRDAGHSADAISTIQEIEEEVDWLRQGGGYDIKAIADGHQSFSRSGDIKPVLNLHCPTVAVEPCGLLAADVAGGAFTSLYALLGSPQEPTGPALVRALTSHPDQSLLFNRLEAYRALGRALADLSAEPIIIVGGHLMTPGTLTFPSTTNWWGKWKTPLDKSPDTPDRGSLLEKAGVVHQALSEDLSRGFFEWLSKQGKDSQKGHLQQIIRHWGERRHGPSRWCERYPTIPCIPVLGRNGVFDLLSRDKATSPRSMVFLPDFREVQDAVISDNASARLAITSAKGVADSVIDLMREIGVPSLRLRVGRPIAMLTSEGVGTDSQLDAVLSAAQSNPVVRLLTQRLPECGVPVSALRRGWQHRLEALKGVRLAGRLDAVFSLRNRNYQVTVRSGVDQPTQLLCVDKEVDRKLAFYDALAEHLFEEGVTPLFAYGLLRAVESRHQPMQFDVGVDLGGEDAPSVETASGEIDLGPREPPRKGHGLSDDNLQPVVPAPGPLDDISDVTKLSGRKYRPPQGRRAKSSTDDVRNSVEEEEQKLQLKEGHYGWHCQACLGEYDVIKAAPPRSYVYLPIIRRKLIEAHHVEHLQNNGAIGAKNLIVLCGFHHDLVGDQLSSIAVIKALSAAKRVTRSFPCNPEGTAFNTQEGLVAEIPTDSAPFRVLLFFTEQHASAWGRSDDQDVSL